MSYNIKKFKLLQNTNAPARQTISTSYTEINGSSCEVSYKIKPDFVYKFNFYLSTIYTFGTNAAYDKALLHIKLQKSNDNFSSNIVDVTGCNFNASGDTQENRDYYYNTYTPTFILNNLDSSYLRLVARSYSTSNKAYLHRAAQFDGSSSNEVYFNTTLLVMEI
tara:strand:+ start:100 stop:591 length:492 start_codon:yes stop_codon:yes gene_type:complete